MIKHCLRCYMSVFNFGKQKRNFHPTTRQLRSIATQYWPTTNTSVAYNKYKCGLQQIQVWPTTNTSVAYHNTISADKLTLLTKATQS